MESIGNFLDIFGKGYTTVITIVVTFIATYTLFKCWQGYKEAELLKDEKAMKEYKYCMFGAAILTLLYWVFVWLTQTYKTAAQVGGLYGSYNIASAFF
jgi:Na+/H+ antiporter NhaD/arsenite permease-like protein